MSVHQDLMCMPLRDTVKRGLQGRRDLRDDDNKLVAWVWQQEAKRLAKHQGMHDKAEDGQEPMIDLNRIPARWLLHQFWYGKLSHPESIRRVRQKLQRDTPGLRGEKYLARQAQANTISHELKEWSK